MKIDPNLLLRQLASSGSLGGLSSSQASPASTIDQSTFADLLTQAQNGTLSTKAPVTVQPGVNVNLNDSQLVRLSGAADRAEAAGLRNALVTIDGQQLLMDVHARQITGTAESQQGIVKGVDGVIDLGNSGATPAAGTAGAAPNAQPPSLIGPPSALIGQNASLARLLQTMQSN